MWLRRMVGIVMIITLVGMNVLVVVGLVKPDKQKKAIEAVQGAPVTRLVQPTVTMSVDPASISSGTSSAINWSTTGNPTQCTASGPADSPWNGVKTPFGAESTGRLKITGNITFTLKCTNAAGSAQASAEIAVGTGVAPKSGGSTSTSKPVGPAATVYCYGLTPCYSAGEISSHGSSGNCWGYNLTWVLNISGFDTGYHQTRSGVSSIETNQICGKDLTPALNGSIGASGAKPHAHNSSTLKNADPNLLPYRVGYFDPSKP